MNNFSNLINQSSYNSTLERINEISKLVDNVNDTGKGIFANVMHELSCEKLKSQFHDLVDQAAKENNLDPKLVNAVIEQESGFNPNAISSSGALGLMQLMPGTARRLGVKNPLNPAENVMAGTKYLSSLLNRYQGNVVLALSAYNAGPGNVEKFKGVPPFEETKNYIKGVISKLT